jgi:hypothetical protein
MLHGLDKLQTPLVLLMFEDYFVQSRVNSAIVNEFADLMCRDARIKHIGLTHFGSMPPFHRTDDVRLWRVGQRARYRISTQAGLWRVDTLRSYLRPRENSWAFEIFGTWRARNRSDLFLTTNREIFRPGNSPIIEYMHTGIIKGKWHPDIPELFRSHGISVDVAKRGLFKPRPKLLQKLATLQKLLSHPIAIVRALCDR